MDATNGTAARVDAVPPAILAPTCGTCGAVSAPDGTCFEIGACETADRAATRGAGRATAKYAVPAAWNARGSVD